MSKKISSFLNLFKKSTDFSIDDFREFFTLFQTGYIQEAHAIGSSNV